MKKILLTLLSVLFCAITFAQSVPQGINYQAVARDASGAVLMNQALTIQFSVISDIATSAVSWQETHTVSTNDYGLYTAIIGQGTATSVGSSVTFDVIDWGASNHLLKVEVDFGSGYVDMGTTAFMSVPYSLYSANSDPVGINVVNEMVKHIYNRQLTGAALYGGISPGTATHDGNYKKYMEADGATRTSYFGFDPTSGTGNSSRPISSKGHFLRDTWITGLYMNTPWCDAITPPGNLFKWGVDSYVDIEIGSGATSYTKVYRLGNDAGGTFDDYYFPSSAGIFGSTGGVQIDLLPQDWIFIPAGTNQTTVIRFKYFMGSGGAIWVLDTYNGTNYHHSEIDGYVTYVQ
ncbi:hypothetical protein N9815_01280 [Flavobacteriales bacterium]|nr:hypothetical protein [Flavobacteriales bacterium]